MRAVRTKLMGVSVAALCAVGSLAGLSVAGAAMQTMPVAWRVSSPTTLHQPALLPTGVVTTAGNTTIARGLVHGVQLWKQVQPDPNHYGIDLGAPTLLGNQVDVVLGTAFGDGLIEYDAVHGTPTVSGPDLHQYYGQLITNGTSTARLIGGYAGGTEVVSLLDFGAPQWFVSIGGSPENPAIVGTRAFVPMGSGVLAFDPAQGCHAVPQDPQLCFPTWQASTPGTAQPSVAAGAGRIAVPDASGVVTAFNATTGAVVWATPSFGHALAPATASGNVIYVGDDTGALRAINATTGHLLWTGITNAPIRTAPTVSGGRVYVATDNGRLAAFPAAGCSNATCPAAAVGDANLNGTRAAGAPLVRANTAIVAFNKQLVAFTV